ncbi:SNF2_N domain-containing protein/Helicase_C domain-containing protein/zf-C3HC4_2 domain-containing protein, partial [Cephalotus follicularis]
APQNIYKAAPPRRPTRSARLSLSLSLSLSLHVLTIQIQKQRKGAEFSAVDDDFGVGVVFDGGDDLTIDLDTIFTILDEDDTDPLQNSPENPKSHEDSITKDLLQRQSLSDSKNHKKSQPQSGFQRLERGASLGAQSEDLVTFYPSYHSEALDARKEDMVGSFYFHGKLEPAEICSPTHAWFGSPKEWNSPQSEIPICITASSFIEGDCNRVVDNGDNLDPSCLQSDARVLSRNLGREDDSKYASRSLVTGNSNVKSGYSGGLPEIGVEVLEAPGINLPGSMEISFMYPDLSPHYITSTEFSVCHSSDAISDSNPYPDNVHYTNMDHIFFAHSSPCHVPSNLNHQVFPSNEEIMTDIKDEVVEFPMESACSSSRMFLNAQVGRNCRSVSDMSTVDYTDIKGHNIQIEGSSCISPIYGYSSSYAGYGMTDNKASLQQFNSSQPCVSNDRQVLCLKGESDDELVAHSSMMCGSVELIDEASSRKSSYSADDILFVDENSKQLLPASQKHEYQAKDEKEESIMAFETALHFHGIDNRSSNNVGHLDLKASELTLHGSQSFTSIKRQLGDLNCNKEERDCKPIQPKSMGSHLSIISTESIQSNSPNFQSCVDNDPDICILEDISQPTRSNQSLLTQSACSNQSLVHGKSSVTSQHSTFSDPLHASGMGRPRIKANDERLILRAALQTLPQQKSEASPPDGLLTVSLLRHQRIALSWMIHKETGNQHCFGGILADDQGLGKTISTIALILKERPPSFGACSGDVKGEMETLNLDDDDEVSERDGVLQEADYFQVMSNQSSTKRMKPLWQAKGRPAAGTLVVCPTSVLRQWADELQTKVTSKANISILLYHGSNRTKDPAELAKYDVVLTTYAIVSMEVPKQPLVDKDDDEKGTLEADGVPPLGLSSSKKRKYPPGSDKKSTKHKNVTDSSLLESVARPLAKVTWFRVVLDEAQSIKNYRTQVARACWGLRAKRRWCLSGTPIQNAIDDLYSYFRFLKYEPFSAYKSFCSTIKVPISKHPAKGYRKLQAVLKTIMLRRTKATILDGQPIITLPPKVVELKKVEFTVEERDFYTRLEAESRAQFQEYADAGTVKQNYVNILLMLLRLRQACDHPLLVKGFDSRSLWRSSIEMAKKLPQEKQTSLLNCLEASLAICGICNDSPEDAVVSVCGHVFCNQCICEHISGDDSQCPVSNCKVRLSVSAVFSKTTLTSTLSEQPAQEFSPYCSGSERLEVVDHCTASRSYDSSKIKAALEVLQSLANPRGCTSINSSSQNLSDGNTGCPENSSDLHEADAIDVIPDQTKSLVDRSLNDSIKVVGEKAIVFSQWTRMLDLLEACLRNSSIQYRRLDGTMSVVARDKAVKDFNTLPEVSVMIMSLKAASLGLNLVAACHVILLDLWWNPTTEDQAIDRAHRIGQVRPVTVLRLTVKDTVEDRILALQQKKREMVASAFGEDEHGSRQTRLTVEDLNYLF